MATHDETSKSRNAHAAEMLRRLDEIGAINLDILVSKSAEITSITGSVSELDPEDRICYPFIVRVGPRSDIDLVSVAGQLRQLGFEIKRIGKV